MGIVKQHGGTVSAENRNPSEGSGARFVVRLPLAPSVRRAGNDFAA
jgi:signal transduction histidine kinase